MEPGRPLAVRPAANAASACPSTSAATEDEEQRDVGADQLGAPSSGLRDRHGGQRGGSAQAPPRAGSGTRTRPALDEELGDLDGVRGRALAQVVADDPEVQAALVRGVAADPADEHLVAARRVGRERVDALGRVVEDDDARCRGEQLAARAPATSGSRVCTLTDSECAVEDRDARTGRARSRARRRRRGSCASRPSSCAPRSCSRRRP